MKKLTSLSLLGLLLGAGTLTLIQSAQAQSTIEEGEKVIIGFDDTFAPFGFKDESGEIVGFDIDLAQAVLGKLQVDYEFQPIDWSTKETELKTGNIDMIWNGYTITPEREKVVLFSDPYVDNKQVILVKADSPVQTKADLKGKVVATQAESSSLEGILKDEEFVAGIDGGQPITYATFVEVFADLDNGRADAIVVDETLATYYLAQAESQSDYRILEENFGEEEYAVGFRPEDQAFVDKFNQALEAVIEEGTFEEIEAKWFADLEAE